MRTILGDCLEVMKTLETNSVDSVVTDPPYGLSFMGKKWDYDVPSTYVWREALRVLRPGGHLLSFGGTRTYHRMVVAIEDAGFEIRDQIQWIYGSGFPKSHNLPGGIGTALKPANEPIVLARKPLIGTVAKNVAQFGVGGLNIDASRIEGGLRPARDATAKVNESAWGTYQGSRAIGETTRGRWPANVLFDEEAAALLDEQSGVSKSTGGSGKVNRDGDLRMGASTGTGANVGGLGDSGGASRFFYVAKASKRERNAGMPDVIKEKQGARPNSADASGKFPDHDHRPSGGNNHPTVKPIKLMQYLIRLVTPPGGIVLDPFMGSGTTGCACVSLGFDFIGIEMSEKYKQIADNRIDFHSIWPESPDAEIKEEQIAFELNKEA